MLRFYTGGESHGEAIFAFIEGLPAALKVNIAAMNVELARRQAGYGRSSRQKIENDQVKVLSGIHHGITTGAPIVLTINNRDFENWTHVMSTDEVDLNYPEAVAEIQKKAIDRFRPGHADLAGTLKFRHQDVRDVLERASARETAARVAAGALCEQLLNHFSIKSTAHVLQIGHLKTKKESASLSFDDIHNLAWQSDLLCLDNHTAEQMRELINKTWQEGNSLGGVVEVVVENLPVGLGNYTQWDLKLDGRLAQALMSIQAVKAVEIGDGIKSAQRPGSLVHDALYPNSSNSNLPFKRLTNHAGGLEGGMTNGERLVIRAYMKPLSTLREGLDSLSFPEFTAQKAHYERSDICAVPACAIVCKAMTNIVLTATLLDKFGGDNIVDLENSIGQFKDYCKNLTK